MITQTAYGKIAPRESHVVQRSRKPKATPSRLLVINHGVGQTSNASAFTGIRYTNVYKTLVDAGFILLHFDGVPTAHWGNDATISRMTDAVAWAMLNLPVKTDKISILGFSHGNVLGLNWARQNLTKVQALGSIIGCVNLQDIHDNDRGALKTGIEGAYNPFIIPDAVLTANSTALTTATGALTSATDNQRTVEGPNLRPGTTITYVSATAATLSAPAIATVTGPITLYRAGVAPADNVYATHSPNRYPLDVANITQRHWTSSDDPVALPSEMAAYVANVGVKASTTSFGTVGHSVGPQPLGSLPAVEIATWFTSSDT